MIILHTFTLVATTLTSFLTDNTKALDYMWSRDYLPTNDWCPCLRIFANLLWRRKTFSTALGTLYSVRIFCWLELVCSGLSTSEMCLHNSSKIKSRIWDTKMETWNLAFEIRRPRRESSHLKYEDGYRKSRIWDMNNEMWNLAFEIRRPRR